MVLLASLPGGGASAIPVYWFSVYSRDLPEHGVDTAWATQLLNDLLPLRFDDIVSSIRRTYGYTAFAIQGKQSQLRNDEHDDVHTLRLCLLVASG